MDARRRPPTPPTGSLAGANGGPASDGVSVAGLVLVAGAAALWGTVGVASKGVYAASELSPLTVGFLRLALSVPILMALSLVSFGRRTFAFRGRELGLILVIGVAMALYQVFYFTAVSLAGVAIATLVTICTAPLLVALLSGLVLGERLTGRVLVALAAGLAGTVLLVGFPGDVGAGQATVFAGIAWACGSAASYAVFVLASRALAGRHHPFTLIAVGLGAGAVLLAPAALWAGTGLSAMPSPPVAGLLLYIGLVPTALAYVLYFRGMRTTPATAASIVTLTEPLMATVLAWLVFGERLGPAGFFGATLLIGALVVLSGFSPTGRGRRPGGG